MTTDVTPRADTPLIDRARAAATEYAAVMADLEPALRTTVVMDWDVFLTHALSRAGLKMSREFSPAGPYSDATITLTAEGAEFSGCEHHSYGDYDYFDVTIPWDFIDTATRRQAEERIRTAMRAERDANDAAARKQVEHAERQQRKADEAELAALAKRLGKTVVD